MVRCQQSMSGYYDEDLFFSVRYTFCGTMIHNAFTEGKDKLLLFGGMEFQGYGVKRKKRETLVFTNNTGIVLTVTFSLWLPFSVSYLSCFLARRPPLCQSSGFASCSCAFDVRSVTLGVAMDRSGRERQQRLLRRGLWR